MADLSVTSTSVLQVAGSSQPQVALCGEAITAGQSLYLFDGTTNPPTYKKADADASAAAAACVAIALTGGSTGQVISIATAGTYIAGATVVVGKVYIVSATAGGIAPVSDAASGMFTTIIGVGTSATVITLYFKASGVAVP